MPLFEHSIALKPSKDYQKLVLLTYVLALIVLTQSWLIDYWGWVLLGLIALYQVQKNDSRLSEISYKKARWQLIWNAGKNQDFNQLEVVFDTGFFMILKLTNVHGAKKILLFHDQLNKDDLRFVRIIPSLIAE